MSAEHKTQLAIIGGGPGGYTAAFLAADRGYSVTIVDTNPQLGGICLHEGCIPSKTLLHAAHGLFQTQDLKRCGIDFGSPKINIKQLRTHKDGVIKKLAGGLATLARQRNVAVINGSASFTNATTLTVKKNDSSQETLTFEKAIIANGSRPATLSGTPQSSRILYSRNALALREIPQTLLVVGGGYIGLELGTVYAALGSAVTIAERTPTLLPGVDPDLVAVARKRLNNTFKDILLETTVTAMRETTNGITVTLKSTKIKEKEQECAAVLIATGRKPNTENLNLGATNIKINKHGFISVDAQRKTDKPHIYAIGDVVGEPMLAHKASHEAHIAVAALSNEDGLYNADTIPAVVFTDPEIAWCGITENQAKKENRQVAIATFPWAASGRAATLNRTAG